MSTATVTAGNVRPLSAIKADMANVLANKPESIIANAKSALAWLPRKAYNAAMRALRFLHVPQFASFIQRNLLKFIGIVGKGAFAVEMLTSHWGQKTLVTGVTVGARLTSWAIRTGWKIVTSPLRLFTPTKTMLQRFDTAVGNANAKLTPNSGKTYGPLQLAHQILAENLSADRKPIRFIRTTAVAVMTIRITRRFVPVGWLRVATYILDGILIARSYDEILEGTWLGSKLSVWQTATVDAEVERQTKTIDVEHQRLTQQTAADTAGKLRAEADKVEADGIATAKATRDEMASVAVTQADELRSEADSLEQTAERLAVAGVLADAAPGIADVVTETPKPGPTVPQMGGAAPRTGPQQQSHQRHGGGKGAKPPQKR